ncbi:MAG: hypothetical protein LBM60_09335 [Clostridium sp.]|nr:hypothetical protein [Clostridium sp.]
MLKRKFVGAVVLGLVLLLSASKGAETSPETTPASGSVEVPSQETKTQAATPTASQDGAGVVNNDDVAEAAQSMGLQLDAFYDINGNFYWGTLKFTAEGEFYYDDMTTGVFHEGEWTIADGEIIALLPDYPELLVKVTDEGDAVLVKEERTIIGFLESAQPTVDMDFQLISDNRSTYMDQIFIDADTPASMYWVDYDDEGNLVGEGVGTYKTFTLNGQEYAVFTPDNSTYDGADASIVATVDGDIYTDGDITWGMGDGDNNGGGDYSDSELLLQVESLGVLIDGYYFLDGDTQSDFIYIYYDETVNVYSMVTEELTTYSFILEDNLIIAAGNEYISDIEIQDDGQTMYIADTDSYYYYVEW